MTPNTAMQTAVMWGYASCSVAVYKYGASVVEHYRYAPPDPPREQPIISPLNVRDHKKSTMYKVSTEAPSL